MIIRKALRKTGIITTSWDDGFYLDVRLAELLDKYFIKGTFYIPNKFTNKLLNKYQIRAIARHHEIGAHSLTHKDLTKLNSKQLISEIKDSKSYLEDIIQRDIKMFAYPFGRFNNRVKKVLKISNFLGARTIDGLDPKISDPFEFGISLGVNVSKISLENWFWLTSITARHTVASKAIWHLAGHSWEIEYFNMWKTLERFFKYIKGLDKKTYLTNGEVIQRRVNAKYFI